jgi:hypothetical protein
MLTPDAATEALAKVLIAAELTHEWPSIGSYLKQNLEKRWADNPGRWLALAKAAQSFHAQAVAAVLAEREACARLADGMGQDGAGDYIATAIRARGPQG